MLELAEEFMFFGVLVAVAAAVLREVHFRRFTNYIKDSYPAIWESLAGGEYQRNPLILRFRVNRLLGSNTLPKLEDEELAGRLRMLQTFHYVSGVGVAIVVLGTIMYIIGQ